MYPLYWTTSKGGIFMRYSYQFKRKAIELFYRGEWPKTPNGVTTDTFHRLIRDWVKLEQHHGPDINKNRGTNKYWTPEEKYSLVCQVLSGQGLRTVAIVAGINSGQLYQWVHKYKTLGYNGLINKPKGRPSKEGSDPHRRRRAQVLPHAAHGLQGSEEDRLRRVAPQDPGRQDPAPGTQGPRLIVLNHNKTGAPRGARFAYGKKDFLNGGEASETSRPHRRGGRSSGRRAADRGACRPFRSIPSSCGR